jgi:peptidoglycan/LPS O-acetylase OafA/YrhL
VVTKIRELDGLRACAILGVVAWHYLGAGDGPNSTAWHLFIVGRTGVDLFFVLSGYLITRILLNSRGSPTYFGSFYRRRALRILPLYAVAVLIYLAGRNLKGGARVLFEGALPWWTYVLGIQNFWMASLQDYGALWLAGTWSLAIEEQFYLLFPLVVYLAPPRLLGKLLVALLLICPIARIVSFVGFDNSLAYYVLMPLRADILAVGALIAWMEFYQVPAPKMARAAFWITALFFPAFALLIGTNNDYHMALWGHTYLVILFGSMMSRVLALQGSPALRFLRGEVLSFFARISYALYLVHVNVLFLTFLALRYSGHNITSWPGVLLTALSFAISVAMCWISYRYFELPIMNWRFGSRPEPDAAGRSDGPVVDDAGALACRQELESAGFAAAETASRPGPAAEV